MSEYMNENKHGAWNPIARADAMKHYWHICVAVAMITSCFRFTVQLDDQVIVIRISLQNS